MEHKIILTHSGGIGCYYTDAEGTPWSTTTFINHTRPCSVCGKEMTGGYSRGMLFEETFFCSDHVQTVYPGLQTDTGNGHSA